MRILIDTNILIHAFNRSSPHREKASKILIKALRGDIKAVISPQVLYEFYSILTNPRRVERPLSPEEAAAICLDLWSTPNIEKIISTSTTLREVFKLAGELGLRGGTIFDCLLAVTAKENGVKAIYTENERDFRRFTFLKVVNPLRGAEA
ncbi:hypothetical protein DRO24_05130 [Candidatus Bathyarchaeota archaeon]|nr:MAG: hypothetical protein DRO24_05130 [Candidatus Bathyarchaeota archaeon]